MADLVSLVPTAVLGGVFTWAAQATAAFIRGRGDRATKQVDVDTTMEVHKDKLTFELLTAARQEVAAARAETAEFRAMQIRLVHFEEAMDHIEAVVMAATPDDLEAARKRAAQYLKRMKRFSEANGAIRNEAQVISSRDNLANEAADALQKMKDEEQ